MRGPFLKQMLKESYHNTSA